MASLNWQNRSVYFELMRVNRPIGTYLVAWPALWALMLASAGRPDLVLVVVFCTGAFLMRSAGCVINDYADRNWDGQIQRTKTRPFAEGRVSEKEALQLFALLCLCAALLLFLTNTLTWWWSLGAVFLAGVYPFTKRITQLPQFVLGMAFAWAIPMAFAAQINSVPQSVWVIYAAVIAWVVAYDTFYAMVDRDEDITAGIKSTAILFGTYDRPITGLLQLTFTVLMAWTGLIFGVGTFYFIGLLIAAGLLIHQQWLIRNYNKDNCFKAFLNNHYVGMAIFVGLVLDSLTK